MDGVVSVGSPIFEEVWFAIHTDSFMALFALMVLAPLNFKSLTPSEIQWEDQLILVGSR